MAGALATETKPPAEISSGKILVEHSSINPNKAAHIGHLRNAILGDTFVRLLRHAGRAVDVQNYIDNTGVQVADVVVGFTQIEKKSQVEIEALTRQPRFDYYCWNLYARVSYLAKHVFQLAQYFNTFYHRHPILTEPDEQRKQFLLVTVAVVRRELIRCLAVLGITVPPVM